MISLYLQLIVILALIGQSKTLGENSNEVLSWVTTSESKNCGDSGVTSDDHVRIKFKIEEPVKGITILENVIGKNKTTNTIFSYYTKE